MDFVHRKSSKFHLQVTDQGLPMGYVVTEASCHDRTAAETVMTQIPHLYNLSDKGFISSEWQKSCMRRTKSLFGLYPAKIRNTAHRNHERHGSNKNGK
ncbi:transposase [Anoxybacillus flavithermus]|nr:transposase [Anoxybacillus flavithermus]